jgi:hypothetical protein
MHGKNQSDQLAAAEALGALGAEGISKLQELEREGDEGVRMFAIHVLDGLLEPESMVDESFAVTQ